MSDKRSGGSPPRSERKPRARVTVPKLRRMKARNRRITMLTAYDATFARMFEEAEIDVLLVGDSLGMVIQGQDSTLPVTTDEVIYHCRAVARGCQSPMIVGDMPFMSYQIEPAEALRNAGRFLAEGGAHAVKLEGGTSMAPTIRRIVEAGIPVMGHIGLTPQSVHAMGGFRVQGKTHDAAKRILDDALAVQEAGAFAIVLEGIPSDLAERITETLEIPTIGIGAGVACDGQVLVCYDLLGLTPNLRPKFVKRYAEMFDEGVEAARRYADEVRHAAFPTEAHSFLSKSTEQPVAAVADAGESRAQIVDLTQPMDENATLYSDWLAWPFEIVDEQTSSGSRRIISAGEHTGTHMDAPVHFLLHGADMADSRARDLARPAVVMDVRVLADPAAIEEVDVDDLQAWESEHGRIPEGAMVLLLTGHAKQGVADTKKHSGFTAAAADWLRTERDISGVGTDALSPEVGGSGAFPVHLRLLADECMILENVRHLDQLPATGATVLMGPLLIDDGSGSPARVVAILGSTLTEDFSLKELTFEFGKSTPFLGSEHDPEEGQRRRRSRTAELLDRSGTEGIAQLLVNTGYLALVERTGTHVAFPAASIAGGLDAASYPLERLIARTVRLDLTGIEDDIAIDAAGALALLTGADLDGAIVAVQTRRWWHVGSDRLSRDYPGLSPQAARALMERGATGIIAQSAGIDPFGVEGRPAERAVHELGGFTGGFLRVPRVRPPPPRGGYLAILPMSAAGTGVVPARIVAVVRD